jgi:hypothetical protein
VVYTTTSSENYLDILFYNPRTVYRVSPELWARCMSIVRQ